MAKFPFSNIDEAEVHKNAFNSNWSCKCKSQSSAKLDENDLKLTINFKDLEKNFYSPVTDFEEQFDYYHSLKPNFNYYTTHEFHTITNKLNKPFSLLHTNICSLQHNGDNLINLLSDLEFKFDVVALTETWNPDDKNHKFQPPIINGYSKYNGTTGNSLKGGCGLYLNSDLKALPRHDLCFNIKEESYEIESFWLEIIFEKQPNRLIGVVYRHPTKTNDTKSIELINDTLSKIKKENKRTLIVGDFNYDLLKFEKCKTISSFLNSMLENNFQPCILEPSRIIHGNKPSLVDNIFSNSVEEIVCGNLYQKISDHMPNFIILQNSHEPKSKTFTKRRSTKNFDVLRFRAEINSILAQLPLFPGFNSAYEFFHKRFLDVLNQHAPFKILTKKEAELERKPWITKGILTSTRIKNKLFKQYKKHKTNELYKRFKKYRDTINSLLRKSKKQYYKIYFDKHLKNSKMIWSGVNSILHRSTRQKIAEIFLNVNGKLVTNQKDVCTNLNRYFVNVADALSKKIPKPNTIFQDYLKNPNEHSIYLKETTQDEVEDIIKDLGDNKACDIYGISNKFIKHGGCYIAQILMFLFNKSIDSGTFPDPMKNAKVVPIHKGDSSFEMSNYRPISLLPSFSKIFEKLMYSRLIQFIDKHDILFKNQFGFQKNMSTEHAVNNLTANITQCFENKEQGFCILLDFAKAFDTVNHDILTKKLEFYGIRGLALKWIKSYLQDRMQCTEIDNYQSPLEFIKCGVPQGSVLGPLLFLLYINDIPNSSKLFKFTLFADDTSLFYSHKNNTNVQETLNCELSKINEWLSANKLSINVKKSKLLIFSDKVHPDNINLTMNNETLTEVENAKYLGVHIDNKLKWTKHINSINLKLSKGLSLLAKIRHFVPKTVMKSMYYTFINPHIEYNLLNWSTANQTELNTINAKLNKAIRIMSFKKSDCPSSPLFKALDILPLEKKITITRAKFMWKLANDLIPTSLKSRFRFNVRTQFSNIFPRLASSSGHILFSGTKIWNNIPNHIKNANTYKTFIKAMHDHLTLDS